MLEFITFFKLLYRKGFYSPNVPEVMQKLAQGSLLQRSVDGGDNDDSGGGGRGGKKMLSVPF